MTARGRRSTRSRLTALARPTALVWVVLLALGTGSIAQALRITVDATGGPLVLEDRADAALAAWRDAGLDVDAIDRGVRIRYADASLLGPDVPVLIATTTDPDFELELLVHPDLLDRYPGALVYALGVALGGAPGEGALDPRQQPGDARAPTAEEVAALAEERAADPADLNRDGVVDFHDLLILTERFGERGINLPGDLDGDGVIDRADIELLRERYTFTPLSPTPPVAPTAPAAPGTLPAVPGPIPAPPPKDAPEGMEPGGVPEAADWDDDWDDEYRDDD
jgi:hypothetical protein